MSDIDKVNDLLIDPDCGISFYPKIDVVRKVDLGGYLSAVTVVRKKLDNEWHSVVCRRWFRSNRHITDGELALLLAEIHEDCYKIMIEWDSPNSKWQTASGRGESSPFQMEEKERLKKLYYI